jgi:hypothetical protein
MLFLVMLVPLLLDSFGGDLYEGAGPKSGGGGGATAQDKGNESGKAFIGAGVVTATTAATTSTNTDIQSMNDARATLNMEQQVITLYKGQASNIAILTKYKLLGDFNTICGSLANAITASVDASKPIVTSEVTTNPTNVIIKQKAQSAFDAVSKDNSPIATSIKSITDKYNALIPPPGVLERAEIIEILGNLTSSNTTLINNTKIINNSIINLFANATGLKLVKSSKW